MDMRPRVRQLGLRRWLSGQASRAGVGGPVAFLLLLSITLSGCGGYVQRHSDRGDAYFKDRKYREAISEYGKAIRFSTDNPHIIRQLGLAHLHVGEGREAYAYLAKSESIKPGDPEVSVGLGQLYLANRRPDEAVREAQRALGSDPRNADALDLLAAAYLNQNDPPKAIETYRRITELFPKSAQRHDALGISLMVGQRNAEARKEFETALALAPDDAEAITQLVNLDLMERQPDVALARVRKQIAVVGRSAKLLVMLASVEAGRGNQAAAETAFREAIRLDPAHSDASVALANLYVVTGKLDQAVPLIDSALKTEKTAAGYQLRGVIMQSKGDFQAARRSYEQALALNPNYAQAANNLAWLLSEKLGDNRSASVFAERAYRAAPNDPHIADTFGWIVYRMGDAKRAVSLLTASADKLPTTPAIQYHLGVALLGTGDTVSARRALTRAINSPTLFDDKEAALKTLSALKLK